VDQSLEGLVRSVAEAAPEAVMEVEVEVEVEEDIRVAAVEEGPFLMADMAAVVVQM
jgi:hypothetical protein